MRKHLKLLKLKGEKKMKKLFSVLPIILLIVLFPFFLSAQTWHTANQQTVAWDAVTTTVDGDPIPVGEISYTVYLYNAVTDPDHLNAVELANIIETQYLITLGTEGKYFFGVKAVRTVAGEIVGESAIIWSSDPAYDFGLQYFAAPSNPGGLVIP